MGEPCPGGWEMEFRGNQGYAEKQNNHYPDILCKVHEAAWCWVSERAADYFAKRWLQGFCHQVVSTVTAIAVNVISDYSGESM